MKPSATAAPPGRSWLTLLRWLPTLILWLPLAAYLIFFVAHVMAMLQYRFPLDYGEGPLLAQINQLRAGTPIWRLYADPGAPPYLVVNYPPVYLLASWALSFFTGSTLLAGRLVSLFAAIACVEALRSLVKDERRKTKDESRQSAVGSRRSAVDSVDADGVRTSDTGDDVDADGVRTSDARRSSFVLRPSSSFQPSSFILHPSSFILIFLTIPVVREWAAYLRVDMLGLALGLWGLAFLKAEGQRMKEEVRSPKAEAATQISNIRHHVSRFAFQASSITTQPSSFSLQPFVAGFLLVLAVYTKPSMLAAPLVGGLWMLFAIRTSWRNRLIVLASWAAFALLPLVLLQWASGGWFWLHVVTSNTNRWDGALAQQFWLDQLRLRWPLFVAGLLGLMMTLVNRAHDRSVPWWVAPLYTLVGVATALGVGKVGAYANYFLELYAGLIWLVCYLAEPRTENREPAAAKLMVLGSLFLVLCLFLSMLYYNPLWSREKLRVAGLLEPNPPQLFFRRSTGLLSEMSRENEVLAAQGRVQGAISAEVRAAGGAIFTDTPGIAAQAGATTPLQAFEHRQLFDSGHWDQRPILRDLANGSYPLAVIDFLGNWLTQPMIDLITHRYAQDGSIGTFNMYRPVDPGPLQPADRSFGDMRLSGYRLAPPADGGTSYSPGELVTLTLEWTRPQEYAGPNDRLQVVVQFTDGDDVVLFETTRPLLYGALAPRDWLANQPMQHMQPFTLPEEMLPRSYTIAVGLRAGEHELAPPQPIATIEVGDLTGQTFETGWNVPAPLLAAWETFGIERAGLPLTPAVPFAWGRLQCFERLCLEQRGDAVIQRPLGSEQFLAETIRGDGVIELHEPFLAYWNSLGGETSLGEPISGEALRNAYLVQWTRYARLERNPSTGELGLGRLGDDSLRLSPGQHYRWPSGSPDAP